MMARRERDGAVQESLGPLNYLAAANGIVTALGRRAFDRVGAVKRVVKTAPTRIGGIEQKPRIEDGHHQLRTRDPRQLVVHFVHCDLERRGLGDQITDPFEKILIRFRIDGFAAPLLVPGIDFGLQRVALLEQGTVLRREGGENLGRAFPESLGGDAGAGQRLVFDEAR